jgi:D-sedoheptulose 7-phosphate isomerase
MDYLHELIVRYPQLTGIRDDIYRAYSLIKETYEAHGKVLAAGNGGSAADAGHIVGELMKGFVKKRPLPADFIAELRRLDAESADALSGSLQQGLPAIELSAHSALITACINDMDGTVIYAQQVCGYGNPGDVFIGISTSGNSKNVLYAMVTARAKGIKTIALTGGSGGRIIEFADASIIVPEKETYKIQELHLPIYHALCLMVEDHFFS